MRAFNFGAGPATLPQAVLEKAQAELLNWQGEGMSVMEVSHRSKAFLALMEEAENNCRELLNVPNNYRILFLGFPARFQFSAIPLNFLKKQASYIVSGYWSKMAYDEAKRLGNIHLKASNKDDNFISMPSDINGDIDADYLYFTPNETLTGLAFHQEPQVGQVPLVADMTSCLLSKPIDIERYAMIFAGAQKNIAPSGLTLVIVRDDFLDTANEDIATLCRYQIHAKNKSNYATPPTFNIYMANLVFSWLKQGGGLAAQYQRNQDKASALYEFIDGSDFYHAPIAKDHRSIMNVVFRLADESLNEAFLEAAKANNLLALKGHRAVGGMRASIYNAMTIEGVKTLISFMDDFAKQRV